MCLIKKILNTPTFINQPPVLIDIGASGAIHKKWKKIAPFATCIAFDADERDFDPSQSEKKIYKKLLIRKSLVSDQTSSNAIFHLTKSPHCSSLLPPDHDSLANWAYAPLFEVERTVNLATSEIGAALADFNIDYIDWYKSDSQGIDLKLFKSLPAPIIANIIAAEYEPGIIDAYIGEDKMHHILAYHDSLKKFWLAELLIKGSVRMSYAYFKDIIRNQFLQKLVAKIGHNAPGWAEMTYLNNFKDTVNERQLKMGWIIATLLKQHGFAYELACKGADQFNDPLFRKMKRSSRLKVTGSFLTFRYVPLLIKKFL